MSGNKITIVYLPLNQIHEYADNPRVITDEAVDAVAKSIEAYGFKVPIVVSSDKEKGGYVLVTGHTRTRAATKLGMSVVPAVIADDLTEEQQKAFRIADNKVADFSIFDNKKLLNELKDLDGVFTGFRKGDIFDDLLDESGTELDGVDGFVYEASFKSPSEEKIKKITQMWEELNAEEPDDEN